MKLGMSTWRTIDTAPVARFTGDEQISPETYKELMADGYTAIAAYVLAGARGAGLDVDAVTAERWRRLTAASYYIDDYLDAASDIYQAHSDYESTLLSVLAGDDNLSVQLADQRRAHPLLAPSIRALDNSVAGITPMQRDHLMLSAMTINDAALAKAETSNIDDYIDVLAAESTAMTELYGHTATPYVDAQPNFEQFSHTYRDIMHVAVFGDSASDLREDYEQGITQVPPTVRNIGKLAIQSVRAARRAATQPMTWHMLAQVKPRVIR